MTYGLKEAHDELLSELQELQEENARLRSCLSEDEESARLMIGEYNELREKYEEVCETSAMLRADMAAARERQAKLRAENKKLRELVRGMFNCISHANGQDWFYFEREETGCGMSCVVNGEGCGLLVLADRMRGLGMEVDG